MSKVYYGMSGSDANETQLKIVRLLQQTWLGRPQKKKVIARQRDTTDPGSPPAR